MRSARLSHRRRMIFSSGDGSRVLLQSSPSSRCVLSTHSKSLSRSRSHSMSVRQANRLPTLFLGWIVLTAGCAGEPLWLDFLALNPSVRRRWEEDESYAPTYYARRDELRRLRDAAPNMTPQQRSQLALQLTEVVRNDPSPLMRREAIITLGYLATPDAIPALQMALSDQDLDVRAAACAAWRRHGGPDAAAALANVVSQDGDLDVRIAAVKELQHFRGPAVMTALSAAIEDADPALQYRAVLSLQEVSDVSYGENVYAWREYLRGNQPPLPETPTLAERMTNWF